MVPIYLFFSTKTEILVSQIKSIEIEIQIFVESESRSNHCVTLVEKR